MKCGKAQELFSSYLEKTIQPPMGVAFEQHLAECARCKAAYDRFHATTIVLDELPVVEPPPDMHAMIMRRIEQARREAAGRVKWLHFDWQSVYTLRVPVKALAAACVLLVVFAAVMQLTPLPSYVAGLFGLQRASQHLPVEDTFIRPPAPAGTTMHADVGAGLSVGVTVDRFEQAGTVYDIGLAASDGAPVEVRVYELPDGATGRLVRPEDLTNAKYVGIVSGDKEATARIIQPAPAARSKVAIIFWKGAGNQASGLVYLPPKFGRDNGGVSLHGADLCEVLSELSAQCGAVILAPGTCRTQSASVNVTASSADEAIATVARQAGLRLRALQPSIYVIR